MKNTVFALVTLALLLGSVPAAPTAQAAPVRYTERTGKIWPQWIGRLPTFSFSLCTDGTMCRFNRVRPEMAQKYLPLSLIKTGGMADLIREVENTPNVDTRDWPAWIGDLK